MTQKSESKPWSEIKLTPWIRENFGPVGKNKTKKIDMEIPKKALGRYKIIYNNGITQEKNLISHVDFVMIIKPAQQLIDDLEKLGKKDEARKIKKDLFGDFGDNYFTNKSGLYDAVQTGILKLPAHMGGDSECLVEIINR